MKIKLNGDIAEFQENMTVKGLLESLKIEPARVVVEVNFKIIKKQEYPHYMLKDGDSVEIVSFVGGG